MLGRKFNAGNTITAAIAIYRQNFIKFIKLSLTAHLWLFVPIYGWAKYFAIASWMSKLSLDLISGETSKLSQIRCFSVRALLSFLTVAILSIFSSYFLSYLAIILISTLIVIVYAILAIFLPLYELDLGMFYAGHPLYPWTSGLIIILLIAIFPWFYTNFFLTDLLLTKRQGFKIFGSIKQNKLLIENAKYKIIAIILLSLIVSMPIWIISYIVAELVTLLLSEINFTVDDGLSYGFAACLSIILVSLPHILVFPFWQSVKAATFYQLADLKADYNLR